MGTKINLLSTLDKYNYLVLQFNNKDVILHYILFNLKTLNVNFGD